MLAHALVRTCPETASLDTTMLEPAKRFWATNAGSDTEPR